MKIVLSEVVGYYNKLKELATKRVPVKLSYAIYKNMSLLENEIKVIEQVRVDLLEQYAKKDEAGNPVVIDNQYDLGENMDKFAKEYTEHLQTELDIDIHTVSAEELEKLEDARYDVLSPVQIASIDFMIEG